ncbi:MAG: DHH family phosphoesterase [Verrucomicrobiae bacterium]|nr:DHH family phosphoesterase [Verrucomicrobiae bacterium]
MQSLPKPERIFTHESDLDGLVSGLLLQKLALKEFGEEIEVEPHHYPSWKMRSLNERCAWVCDFSFEKRMDRPGWLILDHHTTEVQATECRLVHDLEKSASQLCYELCNEHGVRSEKLDRLVHLSNVADLYLETDPDFQLAIDYANLVKTYGFRNLRAIIGGDLEQLIDHPLLEVIQTKRRVEDPMGFEWSRQHVHGVTRDLGVMETAVGDSNSIVHRLLEEGVTGFKVLATMYQKANRQVMVSFRSLNGEALPIAREFHGGGHANACGATLPKSVNSVDEAIVYMREHLEPQAAPGGIAGLEDALSGLKVG